MNFNKIKILKEKSIKYNSQIIKSTTDIVKLISGIESIEDLADESTFLICLNSKNQILAYTEIAKGNINTCNIDIKSIFKPIILSNACKFIIIHNHPSGDPTPSKQDFKITKEIKEASKIMHIEFLDHVVIGENNKFCSCMY